ncbi:FHS family L-fucose permease-like MFS transporter [Roseivirga pacifica]|uniref:MFS transporter, FHS family, L-fucose permease n=1 Tax=Roseivirga pacifica TaxID=1267423 RepID=A0A1I0Q257_9BACT|nr:L-fucose:H+ symporter permease [Roseivirga pacifica]RKQ43318.1 FHS family L-fucose permease-like MFS transporter [Roseivirga pacifica]SEW20956.1 MFS transporter, FHS family, L-fucose permease [Roseivirga pacifica]
MKRNPVVPKNLILPFILITSLFMLWGFANAVTDPMVQAFKKVLELTNSQAAWVQMAFYGGYFCMALPAALFVRKYSYKVGVLIGLALYAFGALLFYPAAITEQFWFFCLGLYILTFGLAFLETTANPYILAMGSRETATQRLNLAQAFNPVGLLLGLLVAQQFVLKRLQSDDIADFSTLDLAKKTLIRTSDLMVIRNPYVILGLVLIGIFILILVSKMPQAKGDGNIPNLKETFNSLFKNKKYVLGVIAQVFYVGAQIMCWTYIYQYAEAIGIASETAANYQFAAFVCFLVGRSIGTYMLRFINSAKLLTIFALLAGICTVLTIVLQGIPGLYALVAITLFMSIMFPTIYGISLDGLDEEVSKIGAAGLVMAIVGGALMPKWQGMIIDMGGSGVADTSIAGVSEVNFSFVLPLICFVYIGWYGRKVRRLAS